MKSLMSLILQLLVAISTFSSSAMVSAQAYDASHIGLQISKSSVMLENSGYSDYVGVRIYAKDGSSQDVQRTAAWSIDDTTVAVADSGRILGLKKGTATVTVSYNGYKKTVAVTVKNNENLEKKYAVNNGNVISTGKVGTTAVSLRNEILLSCSSMVNCSWSPTENLYGFDHYVFKAGASYSGIPYTYSDDLCDTAAFSDALSSKYFYQNQIIHGVSQPYFGSDCSGFVSLVWKLSERYDTEMLLDGIRYGPFSKVGSYNSYDPDTDDLKNSYAKLQPGDAVVVNTAVHGHTFIIADNEPNMSPPQIFAYEQSPPYCQFSNYTYDTMADFGFLPFTLKSLK
jgi:hypothetical protein